MRKIALVFAVLGFSLFASPVQARVDARSRICEAKQDAITKRVDQLTSRSEKMSENFASIAQRVMDYYTNKVLPSGKSVSNYDSLVSAIADKKAIVDSAVADAKSKADAFSCDSESPKAQLTEYRLAMQKVISALKEYRTAIKNLIVAVRSVTGATNREASPAGVEK